MCHAKPVLLKAITVIIFNLQRETYFIIETAEDTIAEKVLFLFVLGTVVFFEIWNLLLFQEKFFKLKFCWNFAPCERNSRVQVKSWVEFSVSLSFRQINSALTPLFTEAVALLKAIWVSTNRTYFSPSQPISRWFQTAFEEGRRFWVKLFGGFLLLVNHHFNGQIP